MGDKTPERKGLLWWIEHENTNEAWTMKNPWAVGAIVLTIQAPRRCRGYRVHNGILRLLMVAMSYLFSRALVGLWRSVAEGGVFCTRSRVISP